MTFRKLTPNLVVRDVAASAEFYRSMFGMKVDKTVPEAAPYLFASMVSGSVEIFLNDQQFVAKEFPAIAGPPLGGTLTLYIEVEDVRRLHDEVLAKGATVTMPLTDQFYGMREFAMRDPDGWVLMFAQPI